MDRGNYMTPAIDMLEVRDCSIICASINGMIINPGIQTDDENGDFE